MENMKIIKYTVTIFFIGVIVISCEDQLETKLVNQYGDDFAWGRPNKAEGILYNAYTNIGGHIDMYGNDFLDAATDNALTIAYGSDVNILGAGGISSSSFPIDIWKTAYKQFQYINLFLEKGLGDNIIYYDNSGTGTEQEDSIIDQRFRRRLKGEAFFLRAWWGMELLRLYGGKTMDGTVLGYPIIDHAVSNVDKDEMLTLARDNFEECVLQIIKDCDSAIALLPNTYTGNDIITGNSGIGRASGKAAYALRSRVATYAASPAYQPAGISDDSIKSKWERAAIYSYEAITKGDLGAFAEFTYAKTVGMTTTPAEYLFRKYHQDHSIESRNLPPYFFGAGRTNPSQNLVDAFPASNGYPITGPLSHYNPQNPYASRDKRLALCVIANGMQVEADGRPLEVSDTIVVDSTIIRKGYDAPGAHYQNTRTGYYLRKFVSNKPNILLPSNVQNDHHLTPLLRRAEVYFNLVEALNEAVGPNATLEGAGPQTAADILTDIRSKYLTEVGTDPYLRSLATDKETFRPLIQNERRLEFAFENMRYFDMRRWLLPLEKLSEPIRGMRVNQALDGSYTYFGTNPNESNEDFIIESRQFNDEKYYYGPIPYSEIIKSPNIVNNLGW